MTFNYRAWRERMNLTNRAAAALIGISLRQSYYLSRGDYQPRQPTVISCLHFEAQKEENRDR